jgi:hypothetical protein
MKVVWFDCVLNVKCTVGSGVVDVVDAGDGDGWSAWQGYESLIY